MDQRQLFDLTNALLKITYKYKTSHINLWTYWSIDWTNLLWTWI